MANYTYIVEKGDTLWQLAKNFGVTVSDLVKWNNISDPDYIVVGQKIVFNANASTASTENTTSKPEITVFGLQSNTDRTIYATWKWDKTNTKEYQVTWYYDTGDNVWFEGTDSTVKIKQSIYNAPSNAKQVKFKVKAISETRTVNDQETAYWTAAWSTEKTYDFTNNPPTTPSTPTVTIEDFTLTARVDNQNLNAVSVEFEIVKDDSKVFKTGKASIVTNSASYSCTVDVGGRYKVRCRSHRGSFKSEWSEYSSNVETIPSIPDGITECKAASKTSVYLEWSKVENAETYDIEYATNKNYFDGSDQTTTVNGIKFTHYEKTGLTSGEEYFFRVRAVNVQGESGWSEIKSTVIGKNPAAPTTWSSTTTAITGESISLYWVHNSEDGSSQTYAELELNVDGYTDTLTIQNSEDEDEKDKTSSYVLYTSGYRVGAKIQWRVRTAGITKIYGDWSTQRTIDIYAPPTLQLSVVNSSGNRIDTLTSFPFYVYALGGPNTQVPIGYHLTIFSNETYETVDSVGNRKVVSAGEQIYSKYFDIKSSLMVELSANNIDLENNIRYTVLCVVSMDSGLTAESDTEITVSWADGHYEPTAEIGIDMETYSAYIRPYCETPKGERIKNVSLAVYRREFDGTFTEIAKGLNNDNNTFITDPHPSLDFARYRIVATSKDTGGVSYYDVPGYPVGGKAAIIQWDEAWSWFDTDSEDSLEQPAWAGSMLKLPYNIDISPSYKPDVNLINYIGREHPVSYYGTHLGETDTWNVEIPSDDKETIYALRRLATWRGDVYVREPSGSGYWANVTVSFNKKHCAVTVPVTLNITRVEGGV